MAEEVGSARPVDDRPPTKYELRAERLARRLDVPFTVAGVVFVVVVIADLLTPAGTRLSSFLSHLSWVLWSLFVLEFLLRLVIARSARRFLRRNWWQILFLALPFLRFLRALTRTARLGRIASSSLRTRSAASKLGGRVAWLAGITVMISVGGGQLLADATGMEPYSDVLYGSALATIAGEQVPGVEGWPRVIVLVMVAWSAIGFAALAGSIGAFLLEQHDATRSAGEAARPARER